MQSTGKIDQRPSGGGQIMAGDGARDAAMMNARAELVGRISAGLAHDLNGPIGVMIGFTQLALEKLEVDDPATAMGIIKYLKMIESAGENARDLARDMWDFARMIPGKVEEFQFDKLLETSARLVAPSLRVAAIEPPASGKLPAQTVNGDRAMWTHAVVGVMIEAPTALPGGGGVTWNLETHSDEATIRVQLIASPNEPETSMTPPSPAQEWECNDSTSAAIDSLGGALRPSSGLRSGHSGIEITVPRGRVRRLTSGGRD